ncbi:MAG: type I-E CRISPR-associated protein Cse1/CasA [Gammaproteobacteria bacterium]|nr:type I-E CRISPR-associated protein Cse1/CasA [Gammaproteobacteria bacterium]
MKYNLIDEAWIPVTIAARQEKVGLAEAFQRADEIVAVGGDSPPVKVALHRLLFSVFMAAVGRDGARWVERWQAHTVPANEILAYLERHRNRFDLLDTKAPFYQAPGLATLAVEHPEKVKDVGILVPSVASERNKKTLFNHTTPDRPVQLTLDASARWLVTLQAYDLPGLKTGIGLGAQARASAKVSPLCGAIHVTPVGRTFAETLLLNCVEVRDWESGNDRPAWERPPVGIEPKERAPEGTLDWLTWQSRRVLLIGDDGRVDRVVITPGDHHAPRQRWECEPYVPFRRNEAKTGDTYNPIRLSTSRQAWRDLYSIIAVTGSEAGAAIIRQLVRRLDRLGLDPADEILTVEVGGTITDQKHQKVLDWRSDRFVLPLALAANPLAAETLRAGLDLAKAVARSIRDAVRMATTTEKAGHEGDGWANEVEQTFWARLAAVFPAFTSTLGSGDLLEAADSWRDHVRRSAQMSIRPVDLAGAAPGNWERWAKGLARAESRSPYDAFADEMQGVRHALTEEVQE